MGSVWRKLEQWLGGRDDPDQAFKLVLSGAVAVLVALFLAGAWQARSSAYREAETRARTMAATLQSYSQNAFDGYAQTLERVDDYVAGMSDRDVRRSSELHRFLQRVSDAHPQVGAIWIVGADGALLASSSEFPAPDVNIGDRAYIRALRAGQPGPYIGDAVKGKTTGRTVFTLSRARKTTRGDFNGAIVAAAAPEYFSKIYSILSQGSNYSAALVRDDGTVLVRDAEALPSTEQPKVSPVFFTETHRATEGVWVTSSENDHQERIVGFKKLDGYPVFAMYGIGTSSVAATWMTRVGVYGSFALPATAILVWLAMVALRSARDQRDALAKLQAEVQLRKRTEAQLIESHKMEALGQLTGGIAHDFNNLLTVLLGNADMLSRSDAERREKLIRTILAGIDKGRRLTSQLLAFARRQPLQPEVTDVSQLILGMRDLLAQSLRGDIELSLELAPDLWPTRVDPAQLRVALISIAANSRDAMPAGGRFEIRTLNGVGTDATDSSSISIILHDTGIGMPADVLARAFEPFFSSKGVGKGTGLGLSQVYGFARQSGGSVRLDSVPGGGTTVTLRFPRAEVDYPASAPVRVDKEGQLRILLVEDNEQVAEVGVELLRDEGHVVEHVSGARAAIERLEAGDTFDLLFSDVIMPGGMDGVALAMTVRARWPSMAIVLTTGYIDVARRQEAADYVLLAKPYSRDDLVGAIARATSVPAQDASNVVAFQKG